MEGSSFLANTIWIFGLLTIATLVYGLARRIKIPFAVLLLATGICLRVIIEHSGTTLSGIEFSPEMVFYVFLPTLIFESAYHLDFRQFRNVLLEVTALATVGLAISVLTIGAGVHYLLDFSWGVSFLFGALISATDPVAVLAVFRSLRAPKKLVTIVDGESLLNDGTAFVLFQFLLASWAVVSPSVVVGQGFTFLQNIVGGIGIGALLGVIFSAGISRSDSKGVQLTLSLILAHVTFLFAEGFFHVSGILATMTAGIIMGTFGKRKLSTETARSFSDIWQFLEFISNALIFLLLGLKLGDASLILEHWSLILISSFITIVVARPLSVIPVFFVTNKFRKPEDRTPFSYQLLTIWGGIRGALAAAAVLLIPDTFPYVREFQSMTTGVILATFFLKATTLPFWLKQLGLTRLSKMETLQRLEAKILIDEKIRGFLRKMKTKKYISPETFADLIEKYSHDKNRAQSSLEKLQKDLLLNGREAEKVLTRYALGIEAKSYKRIHELREICGNRLSILLGSIYRQTDRLDKDILPTEEKSQLKYAPNIPNIPRKKWRWIHTLFLRWKRKLILERFQHYRARRIASWQVILDFQSLKETHPLFADSSVLKKILKRYQNWNRNAERKLLHLQNKFPAEILPLKIQMAERICLRKEQEIENEFLEKGLISEKVFERLDADICARKKICKVHKMVSIL